MNFVEIVMISPSTGVVLLTVRVKLLLPSAQDTEPGAAPAMPTPAVTANPAATANALTPPITRRVFSQSLFPSR